MTIFVFVKDPDMGPEKKIRQLCSDLETQRKLIKERVKQWSQTQGNSTDAASSFSQGIFLFNKTFICFH